jgi:Domain of unknown function (DUF4159)
MRRSREGEIAEPVGIHSALMRPARPRPLRLAATMTAVFLLASAALALAQFRSRGLNMVGSGSGLAPDTFPDGDFVICRLVYTEAHRFAGGWRTDHPLGERNLSIRFAELTKTRVSKARDGSPNHYLVRLMDDQLFSCPILMAGDVGSMGISPSEATRLRDYLLKGGFLWTDDMWGDEEWDVWQQEIAKVFPPQEYPIEEITPADPIFKTQFVVKEMPQVPNLPYWRTSGGDTSEQGSDSAVPHFHAIRDRHGRVMLVMTRNTDIADSFEREGDDPAYFARFSPTGYALGINVLLYALTH